MVCYFCVNSGRVSNFLRGVHAIVRSVQVNLFFGQVVRPNVVFVVSCSRRTYVYSHFNGCQALYACLMRRAIRATTKGVSRDSNLFRTLFRNFGVVNSLGRALQGPFYVCLRFYLFVSAFPCVLLYAIRRCASRHVYARCDLHQVYVSAIRSTLSMGVVYYFLESLDIRGGVFPIKATCLYVRDRQEVYLFNYIGCRFRAGAYPKYEGGFSFCYVYHYLFVVRSHVFLLNGVENFSKFYEGFGLSRDVSC